MSIFEDFCAEAGRRGKGASDDGRHASYIGTGLLESDTGFEAGETFVAEVAQKRFIAIPLEWEKERGFAPIEKMEARREDADDFARFPVDVERLAQDGSRAAESFLPVAVAENDGVRRSRENRLDG